VASPATAPSTCTDGQRFAVLKAAEEQAEEKRAKVVFIQNFFEKLRRVAPTAKR